MHDVDVAIVGAGPAGATMALNLAPFRSVVLIDRVAVPGWRIGECLPGAARRLLADMDLWNGFVSDGHAPCHAYRSAWSAAVPVERDTIHDPDGPGWHLDRVRFERRLRAVAAARGAMLLAPAQPGSIAPDGDGFRLVVDQPGIRTDLHCRLLVDAGGRNSRLVTRFGAQRRVADRLICAWARFDDVALPPGLVHIEAELDGWWYAAALPSGAAIVAFHTDADLPAARAVRSAAALAQRAARLPMLGPLLVGAGDARSEAGYCAAHSARLRSAAGAHWLAIGDAALAFDPLASQGLYNALYTGLAAAEAADRHLGGDDSALAGYAAELTPVADTYQAHLAAWYGIERRFAARPFWQRRHRAQASRRDHDEAERRAQAG